MPYITCPRCHFQVYSAAGYSTVDACPRCGAALPARRSSQPLSPSLDVHAGERRRAPRSRAQPLREEINTRLGRVPTFFEPALGNPDVLRELWRRTRTDWLDSPVPAHFRTALLGALARLSPWPWATIASEEASEATDALDVYDLFQASTAADTGEASSRDWPEPGTPEHRELLGLALGLILGRPDAAAAARRLRGLLGEQRYAALIAVLGYLETCSVFAEAHPDLEAGEGTGHRFRRAADLAGVALFELDEGGRLLSVNAPAAQLFGFNADEVIGAHVTELFVADRTLDNALERLAEPTSRLFEERLELIGRRSDSSHFRASLRLAVRPRDGRRALSGVVSDVTRSSQVAAYTATYRALIHLLATHRRPVPPEAVLAAVAESLTYETAELWRVDRTTGQLRWAAGYGVPDADSGSEELMVPAAEGPFAKVLETREPLYGSDLTGTEGADEARPADGPGSILWLPVSAAHEVVAVIEFTSSEARTPDPIALDQLVHLGTEVAELMAESSALPDAQPGQPEQRLAFEGAPLAMALVSVEPGSAGRIIEANRAMSELTGLDAAQLAATQWDELVQPDDVDLEADLAEKLLAGEIPSYQVDKRFQRGDEVFWGELSVSLIRASGGAPLYKVVQLADVSDRKRAEVALRASRDRFASAFDEAPIGMALMTLEGRWIQVNATLCEVFGTDEASLLGTHWEDYAFRDDRDANRRYFEQMLAGEMLSLHIETRAVHADGHVLWIQVSASLVHDYDGSPAYVLVEVQDVTERTRLAAQLERGALRDDLTGLPSRPLLLDRLEQARGRFERTGIPFAVLFANVDGFRAVNERFGRARGDEVLREMGERLSTAVRAGDTVARYGDDEFVVICEDLEPATEEAAVIASRAVDSARIVVANGEEVELGISVGIAVANDPTEPVAKVVERADVAMQAAKQSGSDYERSDAPV